MVDCAVPAALRTVATGSYDASICTVERFSNGTWRSRRQKILSSWVARFPSSRPRRMPAAPKRTLSGASRPSGFGRKAFLLCRNVQLPGGERAKRLPLAYANCLDSIWRHQPVTPTANHQQVSTNQSVTRRLRFPNAILAKSCNLLKHNVLEKLATFCEGWRLSRRRSDWIDEQGPARRIVLTRRPGTATLLFLRKASSCSHQSKASCPRTATH